MESSGSENDFQAHDNDDIGSHKDKIKNNQSGGSGKNTDGENGIGNQRNRKSWDEKSHKTKPNQELVETAASKQNWRGIMISLVVILAVCLLITIAVLLMTPGKVAKDTRKPLNFEDFIFLEGNMKSPHYIWVSDHQYAYYDDELGIMMTDAAKPYDPDVVVPHQVLKTLDAKDFTFSHDLKYVLLEYDKEEIYRYSYRAKYQMYDLTNGQMNQLGPNYPSQNIDDVGLRCVTWSPKNHKLAFVYQNNIYYLPDALSSPTKLTDNDPSELVYNGVPDWLYEEEILMAACSIYWSNQGELIAYGRLNYSMVPRQPMIIYGSNDDIYPKLKMVPYPKVGQNNPIFTIMIVDPLAPTKKVELKFPSLRSKSYIKDDGNAESLAQTLLRSINSRRLNKSTTKKAAPPGTIPFPGGALFKKMRRNTGSNFLPLPASAESAPLDVPYYTSMAWIDHTTVAINIMDRVQTVSHFSICDTGTGRCVPALTQRASIKLGGWIDPIHQLINEGVPNVSGNITSDDVVRLITILPRTSTGGDQYNHVARIVIENGRRGNTALGRVEYLTNGPFDVTEISAFDGQRGILYFVAAPNKYPGHRHIYSLNLTHTLTIQSRVGTRTESVRTRVNTIGQGPTPESQCITCGPWINSSFGKPDITHKCDMFVPHFSPLTTWCLLSCQGPDIPIITLHNTLQENKSFEFVPVNSSYETLKNFTTKITWDDKNIFKNPDFLQVLTESKEKRFNAHAHFSPGKIIFNNTYMKSFLKEKILPSKIFFQIPAPSDNYTFEATVYLPPHFKEDNNQKYPLLVEMYGGPESQIVDSSFGITWSSFISGYYNVVIARIDGRGSGHRGRKFMMEVYKNLGEKEASDQIYAIKYILKKIPIIDPHNVAIWGWSFGGYLTSLMLSLPSTLGLVKCGIAIAPVVDWRFYDSAYTERYMGTLEDNVNNYQRSSLLDKTENFRSHKYLLIHGTADDNVHFQHAALLIKQLVKNNVPFDLMVYPDESHNLHGVFQHMYAKMTSFLMEECYGKEFPIHTEQVKKYEISNDPNHYLTFAHEMTEKDDK